MVIVRVFVLALLANGFTLYADESLNHKGLLAKVGEYIAQSKFVSAFDNGVNAASINFLQRFYGSDDASQEYQKLGKEAQDTFIPKENHFLIKKFSPPAEDPLFIKAIMAAGRIYVNEKALHRSPYGEKRCALFTQAVHKHYNDAGAGTLVQLGSILGSATAARTLIKSIKPQEKHRSIKVLATIAAAFQAVFFINAKCLCFAIQRADIEGHYATQCFKCVQEDAEQKEKLLELENNLLKNFGYLGATDLQKIASDLEAGNKLCAFHKNVTKNS